MGAERQPTDNLIGLVLGDRYQILHRLGEGAMGVVYKARHVKVGRPFAVKVLNARALQDTKVAQRFEREAELAGRLHHPNVVGVVDVGDIDGTRYMVMEFAEGNDLAKLLDEAPMPPERIIRLVRQMLDGLHHAHEQGLIHRDFKPENVIVERDAHGAEIPRIVDFGIALLREGGDAGDGVGRLTTNGLVLGTPHYMAPEQAVADPIDHRIDLFALGIVTYEMLSGRLPFDGKGAEVARANLLLDPPPIYKRVPHLEVDPLLEGFARLLMAKRRETRPATARAARELLDLIERDRPAAAKLLGVPPARSGRAPAVTESVTLEDPAAAEALSSVTTRMKPTPGTSQPIVPRAPAGPVPEPVAVVESAPAPWSAADGVPAMSAMPVYASPLARPPAARAAGRETALQTPLGWPAARPSRRRSWLIGGAVIGTASIAAAAIISLTGNHPDNHPDDPIAGDRAVAVTAPRAPAAVAGPTASSATSPTDKPAAARPAEPAATRPAESAAIQPAATGAIPKAPARAGGPTIPAAAEKRRRAPNTDATRRIPAPPARVRTRDGEAAPREASAAHPASEPAPGRVQDGAPAPRDPEPEAAAAKPARPDTTRAVPASAGISPDDLGNLFYAVGREIRELAKDEQGDLLGRLARFDIMSEVQQPQRRRDEVAVQLTRIRDDARRRKSGSKKP